MKRIILPGLLVCLGLITQAQQKPRYILSGTITDVKTGSPLQGASVLLVDARSGALTDSLGHYHFENIATGHTLIEISNLGYRSQVSHLDVSGATEKDFALVSSIIENEGVTVTATGSATSIRKLPVSITRVSKTTLLESGGGNIINAISKQPGVNQVTTGPAISKPVIRGLGYNRLVVINDGIRQEGQQWGDEHGIEIDDNSVSHVEIVKGPASLIYGSDALAGVINIITTTPVPAATIRGNIFSSYNSNNRERSLFANLGGNNHGFTWEGWADGKAAGDYKNKYDGYVWNSKYNEFNFGASVGLNKQWGYSRLIFSNFHQHLGIIEGERDDEGRFVKLLPGGMETTPTLQDSKSIIPSVPSQEIQHQKLTWLTSYQASKGRLGLNLALQRNQRREFGNPDAPKEAGLYFDLPTFNYGMSYNYHSHNGWENAIGINGMVQKSLNKAEEVLVPEYNLFDAGAYFYTQKTVNKLTWSGGLRLDNRQLNSMALEENGFKRFTAFSKNFTALSASAGFNYAPRENQLFKFNLARGFRAPSIPELGSNGAHEGTNRYEYGNAGLKPETSYQADAGYEVHSEHVLFNLSIFYNQINNFIFYRRLLSSTGTDSMVNAIPAFLFSQQTAHIYGAEALIDIHPHPLDWLHWQTTFSYLQGRFNKAIQQNRNMPLMPPFRAISHVKIEQETGKNNWLGITFFAEADITAAQTQVFTAYNTETNTKGYTLFNSGLTLSFNKNKRKLFDFYIIGNNLGDVAYQNHLSRLKYADENLVSGRMGVFNVGRSVMFKVNVPLSFVNKN
ncbi:MAG: TonB-dependent receptor [Ferruginibacter sp.]